MSTQDMPIVLGAALVGDSSDASIKINTTALAQDYLDVFRKYAGSTVDTSRRYPVYAPGTSEKVLGTTDIASWASIDTKVLSGPGDHAPAKIAESISKSLEILGVPKVHIIYTHYPDRTSPLDLVCLAMAIAIKEGKAEKWGISNYSIKEVKEICAICEEQGYPKPAVYQGHYNALTRKMEDELLPVLRENGVAFYAFSPAAGGAFSKTGSRKNEVGAIGEHVRKIYHSSDGLTNAIAHVQQVAETYNLTGHEVALRWVRYHSALKPELGDAMIVGASSSSQLESTMKGLNAGPLPEAVAKAVDEVWESARDTAPDYSAWAQGDINATHLVARVGSQGKTAK